MIPYEEDEVTRLILDDHDAGAFSPVSGLSVGEFRNWLLRYQTTGVELGRLAAGLTPEMVAAVSKLMRHQGGPISTRHVFLGPSVSGFEVQTDQKLR